MGLLSTPPAMAAQIVALDLHAVGGVKKQLAASLTPLLIDALARREGMSVISQHDVRALLTLEADKQALGCNEASCMSDIAGSLGAELLAASTLSKVGHDYVVSIHLISVNDGKVLSRGTGKAAGGPHYAEEAVQAAVHEIYRKALPIAMQGPASLSRRGFRAALAGLQTAVLGEGGDRQASRKRVVLDLVHTELDYDAGPKFDQLHDAIELGRRASRRRALGAKTRKEFEFHLAAQDFWTTLGHDLGRVKEIRERARAGGLTPSARPLRFEPPEPTDRSSQKDADRYWRALKDAEPGVRRALAAAAKNDPRAFVRTWRVDLDKAAVRSFRKLTRLKEKYAGHQALAAHFALFPYDLKRAIQALDDKNAKHLALPIYLVEFHEGQAWSRRKVKVEKQPDGAWKIVGW